MRVTVAFPAWNESAVIGQTVRDAVAALADATFQWSILVVDNGSDDGTAERVDELNLEAVRVIRHPRNLGYAASTRTALAEAEGDLLFIIDSDGQHTVADVAPAVAAFVPGVDLIQGWKAERQDGPLRAVISWTLNRLAAALLDSPLHDINCGFRGFRLETTRAIEIRHEVNSVGPEVWVRSRQQGLEVLEFPVRHFPRQEGSSIHSLWRLPASIGRLFIYLLDLRRELRA